MLILTGFAILIIISSVIGALANLGFIYRNPVSPLRTFVLFKVAMLSYVVIIYGSFLIDQYFYSIYWFEIASFPYYAWPLILLFTVVFTLDAMVRRAQDK